MVEKITNNKLEIISLFRSGYLKQLHVREIASLLKKNHTTILPHLKGLEKDKILISRAIGRSKAYSINFENLAAKFYMGIAEAAESTRYIEQHFLIKKLAAEILDLKLRATIILFGSYAKRAYGRESDIDLFCLGKISEKEARRIRKLGKIYGKEINLKKATLDNFESVLRKRDALVMEVVKYHIILHNAGQFIDALWRFYDEKRQ